MATLKTPKPIVLFESTADIKKAISSIELKGKRLDADIQKAGVSCLAHISKHGDTTLLDSLVHAMPKGSRKSALVEWAVAVGQVRTLDKANPDDMMAIESGRLFKLDRTKAFTVEEAMSKLWYDFKPEKDLLTVFDVQAAVQTLIKRYSNATRDGAEIKGINEAKAALAQLTKQLDVMGTEL